MLPADPGDIINVETTGTWSPTCALQKDSPVDTLDLSTAGVGPEGFVVQLQNGKYAAASITHTGDSSVTAGASITTRFCAGVKATVGGAVPGC